MYLEKSLEDLIKENKSNHVVTFNAQYAYEFMFNDYAKNLPEKTVFLLDSRPIYYFHKLLFNKISINQGSGLKDRILLLHNFFDYTILIGGEQEKKAILADKDNWKHYSNYIDLNSVDESIEKFNLRKFIGKKIMVLIFLGVPKQDIIAKKIHEKYGDSINIQTISLGGSLDMWNGKYKRSPYFFQIFCLEGLWRFINEPSVLRVKRIAISMIGLLVYPYIYFKISNNVNCRHSLNKK